MTIPASEAPGSVIRPGARVFVHGRLRGITRVRLSDLLRERGAEISRKAGEVTLAVLAHSTGPIVGARFELLIVDRLPQNVPIVSENSFKRQLGLAPELSPVPRTLVTSDVARAARLTEDAVRSLTAYDVLEPEGDRFSFADLRAAREVGRALQDGFRAEQVIRAALQLARSGRSLSDTRLAASPWTEGEILQEFRGALGSLAGQLSLSLGDAQPALDEVFDQAEACERAGELDDAERLYRLAGKLDRSDPVIPFNLGNVLDENGRPLEAALAYQDALARDPAFFEAWYNLGYLAEKRGDLGRAREGYERALATYPKYADALYALARLLTEMERLTEAQPLWERFVQLEPPDKRLPRAKRYLGLCRLTIATSTTS
jgi:tetratricopeptide (TPR) repeat protein